MSTFGGQKSSGGNIQWRRFFGACGPLLPSLIAFIWPSWSLPPFTPRQFIYSNDLMPLLFAPWATPTSLSAFLSRIIQGFFFWRLPVSLMLYCYPLWVLTALLRMILGYVLSRSVGWAYPRLFNHWALYETSGGFGPSIVTYFFLVGATEFIKILPKRNLKAGELQAMMGICALLCWLDNAPWTYGVAIVAGAACSLCCSIFRLSTKSTVHPLMLDGQKPRPPLKIRALVRSVILSLFALSIPYGLYQWTGTYIPTDMPPSPYSRAPLLDILILSHPRPNVTAATTIMTTTIDSYIPFLSSDVVLSVFTHSTTHTAFLNTWDKFKDTNVTFFIDSDSHPDAQSGQYLHLAEAFRWTAEKHARQAEWVMLVEDDFPLCGGETGWNAIRQVMEILERGRVDGKRPSDKLGGFVGTGGRCVMPLSSKASLNVYHLQRPYHSSYSVAYPHSLDEYARRDRVQAFSRYHPTTGGSGYTGLFTRYRPSVPPAACRWGVGNHVQTDHGPHRGNGNDQQK
jgi:hypothetical protein